MKLVKESLINESLINESYSQLKELNLIVNRVWELVPEKIIEYIKFNNLNKPRGHVYTEFDYKEQTNEYQVNPENYISISLDEINLNDTPIFKEIYDNASPKYKLKNIHMLIGIEKEHEKDEISALYYTYDGNEYEPYIIIRDICILYNHNIKDFNNIDTAKKYFFDRWNDIYKKNELVHELQHAMADMQSNGKAFTNYDRSTKDGYYNHHNELEAYAHGIANDMIKKYKMSLKEFINSIVGGDSKYYDNDFFRKLYKRLTPENKKKFINKLSKIWHDYQEDKNTIKK